ncbi:hypothetical protein SteCoe_8037 [Stentor coeruleus]|uniref:Uncharacterized protein n=1 Tax=Stentor coeruleus TaxID=5963 RepID=A0A1R2CL82_9CILI|nr:hypothetical protein SteCoe_8037 [Stentor coeruleus]
MDPKSLLEYFLADSRVKVTRRQVPFALNYELIDISMKNRATEDQAFQQDQELSRKLRRGTSFLRKNEEIFWLRKGLPKFFEFKISKGMTSEHILNNQIFSKVKALLDQGIPVAIWNTVKENGENAQISFKQDLNSWVIGSKNVSLVARYEEDIKDHYKELRFNFAKLIAEMWFSILKLIDQDKIESLKIILSEATLVGEYVGNPDCQHIVQYKEKNISFFAVVPHESDILCYDFEKTNSILNQFNLKSVQSENLGQITNTEQFSLIMQQMFYNIQNKETENSCEGSVFYIISSLGCVEICKIKTLEYKILRKIREGLKNATDDPKLKGKFYNDFRNYIYNLQSKLNIQLDKYLEIAKKMMNTTSSGISQQILLENQFASFKDSGFEREIIFVVGIPGIGKTFLLEKLKNDYQNLTVISSDIIREKNIQHLITQNPSLDYEKAFDKSYSSSTKQFWNELAQAKQTVFIDKNIPPSGLKSLISHLNKNTDKITAFIPKTKNFTYNENSWPFSLQTLYTCIQRILIRKSHPTMKISTPIKNIQILILIYNFYKSYNFDYYKNNGVNSVIFWDFIDENISISEKAKKKIEKIITKTKVGCLPDAEKVQKLIKCLPIEEEIKFENVVCKKNNKVPVFLAIEVYGLNAISLVVKGLKDIIECFPLYKDMIDEDINEITQSGIYPKPEKLLSFKWKICDLHITTLFIGKNSKVLHSPHYQTFQENLEYEFLITHLVYVPKKLICAPIDFKGNKPLISNR